MSSFPSTFAAPTPTTMPPITAASTRRSEAASDAKIRENVCDALRVISQAVEPQRRIVRSGDVIYRAGEAFDCLYILNSGMVKIVKLTSDGREQVVGLKFRSDWLGFDGIARRSYGCDAIAMDTGEVWAIRYDTLTKACATRPELMGVLHDAMSREITRDRESLMSVCTLPADARVADFLHFWADSLAQRGLRTDQITLRMTRAEIGNYLGLTLESVSRALSKLVRADVISFVEKGRREVHIPDLAGLAAFVERSISPACATVQ